MWLHKIPGRSRIDPPSSNSYRKAKSRVSSRRRHSNCPSRLCPAGGPRVSGPASPAAPAGCSARGRRQGAHSPRRCCARVLAGAGRSAFALKSGSSEDPPGSRAPASAAPGAGVRRAVLGREELKFCRILVRPGQSILRDRECVRSAPRTAFVGGHPGGQVARGG